MSYIKNFSTVSKSQKIQVEKNEKNVVIRFLIKKEDDWVIVGQSILDKEISHSLGQELLNH